MFRYETLLLLCATVVYARHPLLAQLDDLPGQIYVCDETNSLNWNIYCQGPILEAVNFHRLYNDSKDYVDSPLKYDPDDVLRNWTATFGDQKSEDIDDAELRRFISDHFNPPGSELLTCTPDDWIDSPQVLEGIRDPALKEWAKEVNAIWKTLCKKMDPSLKAQLQRYSLIWVDNEFIAPGGRFREFYYWDAYWIVKGLIASGMYDSTKKMILNLAGVVDRYGFVPNGGRVYYLSRSQPPLLSGMVYEYFEATRDLDFVAQVLPTLEKELNFWQNNRTINVMINGQNHMMFQYKTPSNTPRPESYMRDLDTSQSIDAANKLDFYQNLASAAESGWDFSTRWFADHKTIYTIETTNVVPVDLNSFICWNMDILEFLHESTGNDTQARKYRDMRSDFRQSLNDVFYNNEDGIWYDFNVRTGSHNKNFYPSNVAPLFTGCYNTLDQQKAERAYDYMNKLGVFAYKSGIPTSIVKDSEEQWDYPNGWSPLNHMVIEGLRKSGNPEMQDQAFYLARTWVLGNYNVWKQTKHMWEKYDVIGTYPQPGNGGEYDVQDGFGWTNGVVLDLLRTYGDRLMVDDSNFATRPGILLIALTTLLYIF